jgi:hypothetical protein
MNARHSPILRSGSNPIWSLGWVLVFWLAFGVGMVRLEAALQFDVFLGYGSQPTGYDGQVRGAGPGVGRTSGVSNWSCRAAHGSGFRFRYFQRGVVARGM